MKSMTGYHSGEYEFEKTNINIDIRSVNNRYLDVYVRLPKEFFSFETEFKKIVGSCVKRGKVSVYINYEDLGEKEYVFLPDIKLARSYLDGVEKLKNNLSITGDITINDLISNFSGLLQKQEDTGNLDESVNYIKQALESSILKFEEIRKTEGAFLKDFFQESLEKIAGFNEEIEKLSGDFVPIYRDNIRKKMQELLQGAGIDESRILMEAAIQAEKSDVTEENVRIKSHIEAFEQALDIDDSIGKRLDFIIQELNREINTIGSKSSDIKISELVVAFKCEIEKMREQVQNVE